MTDVDILLSRSAPYQGISGIFSTLSSLSTIAPGAVWFFPPQKLLDKMTISVHVCLCYTALIKLCYFAAGIVRLSAAETIMTVSAPGLRSASKILGNHERLRANPDPPDR